MRKKERISDETIIVIVKIFGMIAFFALIFWSLYHVTHLPPSKGMNDFCKEEGYKNATDFKGYFDEEYDYKIECDNYKIFEVITIENCEKYNKWNECQYKGYDQFKEVRNILE